MNPNVFEGPIPGANFTSDERNWPWHRAPDITDTDEALDYLATQFTETNSGFRYMNLIETGVPITTITDIVLTLGIGKGKWTVDFALLLAGPTARLLEIMAKSYGITDYNLGIEEIDTEPTAAFFKAQNEANTALEDQLSDGPKATPEEDAGFMSVSSDIEQKMMLGQVDDEEETEEVE